MDNKVHNKCKDLNFELLYNGVKKRNDHDQKNSIGIIS